jgi:serine/threonine protein kinase
MPEMTPIRFGKYLLLEKIGAGGMAQLYRAKETGFQGLEKIIAVKKILPHLYSERDLAKAFVEEAKLAASLDHPNIVQIFDYGTIEGSCFIAMEYILGWDLRSILQKSMEKGTPLSFGHALFIASRICSVLGYAYKMTDK